MEENFEDCTLGNEILNQDYAQVVFVKKKAIKAAKSMKKAASGGNAKLPGLPFFPSTSARSVPGPRKMPSSTCK